MEVVVEGLWKFFGSTVALRDVWWVVRGNGLYMVLGPNGSGKTTLLKILCGVYRASRGRVLVLGEDPWRSRALFKRVAAYFEDASLPWWLKGVDLLKVFASKLGLDWGDVARVAEELGVTEFWGKRVWSYSSGMRKRLALVTVFARNVDLYVLDEPLTLLDREGRELVAKYVAKLSKSSMVLIASHIVTELAREASGAIVLINGVKVFDSSEAERVPKRVTCRVSGLEEASSLVKELLSRGYRVSRVSEGVVEAVAVGSVEELPPNCVARIDVEEAYREALARAEGGDQQSWP